MGLPAFLSFNQTDLSSKQEMMKLLTGQDLLGTWVMKTPPQLSIMPGIKYKKRIHNSLGNIGH
jgi:hypothetical protein